MTVLFFAVFSVIFSACDIAAGEGDTSQISSDVADGVDEYVVGLEKPGGLGLVQTRLIKSDPIPQDTGKYSWTLEVQDPSGSPIPGLKVVAEPTMPSHGHGTFPPTTTGEELGEGRYLFGGMDFFMPGVWQIEIRIEVDGETDTVFYVFDLEG